MRSERDLIQGIKQRDPGIFEEFVRRYQQRIYFTALRLVGGRDGRAVRLYPVENVRHSPVAFEMEPVQQIKALLAMEAEGLELIAIYHSHPHGPARPSTTDVANAYYPDAVQLIISLANRQQPSIRAFTIIDGVVTEVGWLE